MGGVGGQLTKSFIFLYVPVNIFFQLCWDRSSWVDPVLKQKLLRQKKNKEVFLMPLY